MRLLSSPYFQLFSTAWWSPTIINSQSNNDLAQFTYNPTASGTYYLAASELGNDSIGSYTINASVI
ncbi:MAG: hypothetical protein WCW84_14750 [Sulfurimonas sp.]